MWAIPSHGKTSTQKLLFLLTPSSPPRIDIQVQQSPDNHTLLNHTTLLFAPNLPGIKWNVNKFALIIAQKSPDNHTYLFLFSTFTALLHQLLANRNYLMWF